jgi:hypothetical protein
LAEAVPEKAHHEDALASMKKVAAVVPPTIDSTYCVLPAALRALESRINSSRHRPVPRTAFPESLIYETAGCSGGCSPQNLGCQDSSEQLE